MPLSFHGKCVTKCLDLFGSQSVIHCVVQRLDFVFITRSLKDSTKASVSIVVTSLPIGLTATCVSLATNVFISA